MDYMGLIIAVLVIGGTGLLISIFLSFFGKKFAVEVDEKEAAILEALPGNNCGGCGYPGCSGLAAAISKGEAPVNGCPVGGKPVADVVAGIMGVDAGDFVRNVAFVKCNGTCEKSPSLYEYSGPKDCKAAVMAPGRGPKACSYGCLGFGSCINVCDEDAISIIDGIAVIDESKCGACGKCVKTCPMGLIELVPENATVRVACSSKDKGPQVMKACKAGCIGCGICVKTCEAEAITVTNNVAHIDYSKCTKCGACAQKCPKKIINV